MDSWKILTKIFFSVPPVFREELRAPTFTDKQTCNIFFVSHGTNLFFGSHSTKVFFLELCLYSVQNDRRKSTQMM
jgi:hypothetical protein